MTLLSFQSILDTLKSELFKIGGFSVALWMVIALGLFLLILILVIVLCAKASKKKKSLKGTREIEDSEEPLETITIISKEETKVEEETKVDDEVKPEEEVKTEEEIKADEETKDETKESEEEKMKAEPKKKVATKKPTTKKEVKEEKVEEKVETEEKKERPRVYHVSMREDGKWQVKFAKGAKAIKTFSTQLEAIDYAKKLAESQKGSITIHKKDGKIRKQKY